MLCHQKLSVVLASRKLGGGRTGCDEAGNSSGKSLVSSWRLSEESGTETETEAGTGAGTGAGTDADSDSDAGWWNNGVDGA